MNILKIFSRSLTVVFSHRKMIGLLWFFSFLFSLPVFWVLHRTLAGYFDRTPVAAEWLHQFNANYLLEMIIDQPSLPQTAVSLVLSVTIVYLLVGVLLAGGVAGVVFNFIFHPENEQKNFLSAFFEFGGKYYWRFFRVFLLTLVMSALSFVFAFLGAAGFLAATFLAGIWIMTNNVTKIRLMSDNSFGVTKTYFASLVWILKNFWSMMGIYFLNLIFLALGFTLYKVIDLSFTPDSTGKIALMLLLQQLFVLFRSLVRIQFFTGAVMVWKSKANAPETSSAAPSVN